MPLNSKYDGLQIELPEGFTPIEDDEPVFILRGQDGLAIAGIRGYLTKLSEANADQSHIESVSDELQKWEGWQAANPDRIKMPTTSRSGFEDDDD